MADVFDLADGCCPHCGSDDVNHKPHLGDWSCRDCAGSKHERPPSALDLIEKGLTPAEAVDWIAVVAAGRMQTAWAETRGRDQSTISENKNKAGAKLSRRE